MLGRKIEQAEMLRVLYNREIHALQSARYRLIANPVPLKPWESRESLAFQLRAIDGHIVEYQQLIESNSLKLTELRKENIDGISPKIEWGETLHTVYLRVFYPKVKEQKIIFEDGNTCLVTCVAGQGERSCRL